MEEQESSSSTLQSTVSTWISSFSQTSGSELSLPESEEFGVSSNGKVSPWAEAQSSSSSSSLSSSLSSSCSSSSPEYFLLILAIMSDNNSEERKGDLIIKNFKCRNILSKISKIIPSQLKNYFWISDIGKYIEEFKPDIVHFHNPVPPWSLWKSSKVCIKNKIPYVISSHGFVEIFNYKKAYNVNFFMGLAVNSMIMSPFLKTLKNLSFKSFSFTITAAFLLTIFKAFFV